MSSDPTRCALCGGECPPDPTTLAPTCPACRQKRTQEWRTGVLVLSGIILLMAIPALLCVLAPYAVWYATEGWQYSNLEPSVAKLVVIRIGGGMLLLILAIFWLRILMDRPEDVR